MNAIMNALRHPVLEQLGWSLIQLLWQGTPRRPAHSRASAVGVTGLSGLLTIAAALLFLLPGIMSPPPAVTANAAVAPGDDEGPSTAGRG